MTMNRRRLMLGIGAALLVGGWGATQYGKQLQTVFPRGRSWSSHPSGRYIYISGYTGMAVGAGLIGFGVLRPVNRNLLAARGVVIHLDSPLERLVERTQKDKKRPLLAEGDPRETLDRLQRERAPLYAEITDYRFVTDRQGAKPLARVIEQRLRDDGIV